MNPSVCRRYAVWLCLIQLVCPEPWFPLKNKLFRWYSQPLWPLKAQGSFSPRGGTQGQLWEDPPSGEHGQPVGSCDDISRWQSCSLLFSLGAWEDEAGEAAMPGMPRLAGVLL